MNQFKKAWISATGMALLLAAGGALAQPNPALTYTMDQGAQWTHSARSSYYTQDQGSQLIPLKWMMALRQPSGEAFMADSLRRFGYLPNPVSPANKHGLPVGFTTNQDASGNYIGMTCSACHTRQIDVNGINYRIDGGPAMADFQNFMAELDHSVANLLNNPTAFAEFAKAVLGAGDNATARAKLQKDVAAWYLPYHTIVKGSLPVNSPWGPSRLDAVSMIFNRLSGLDVGPAPTYMIPENIKLADAPARYPFLWNAPKQDYTQWPGFSDNGNLLFGLTRNLGEVIGVFGKFHPVKDSSSLLGINYIQTNSANFSGLNKQEVTIDKLGPPQWPWALDRALVAAGEKVFNQKDTANGNQSCNDCHGIKKGEFRTPFHDTWATPILDVGTDTREWNLLGSEVKTGVLAGAKITGEGLKPVDKAFSMLGLSVGGSILQHYLSFKQANPGSDEARIQQMVQAKIAGLQAKMAPVEAKIASEIGKIDKPFIGAIDKVEAAMKPKTTTTNKCTANCYEARVMQGIWAVAPYLHNGSVPTLAELLQPSAKRVAEFKVGPSYDIDKVGLAVQQSQFNYTLKTTDCSQVNSGNSRCGHEFGTGFSDADKKALLEYLKQL